MEIPSGLSLSMYLLEARNEFKFMSFHFVFSMDVHKIKHNARLKFSVIIVHTR